MVARKTIRNVVISTALILLLIVAAGLAYTYYLGPTATDKAAPTTSKEEGVTIKPRAPAADAKASAAIEFLTSPVQAGTNAQVSIKTVPTASCTIKVTYNGVPSTDSGLKTKTANEFGVVDWTWTISRSTPAGTWPIDVTCVYKTRSAYVQGHLEVVK